MTAASGGAPRLPRQTGAIATATVIAAIALAPILVLAGIGILGSGSDWPHLARNVIPRAAQTTAALLSLVAVATATIGVATAWVVVAYDFPLRRLLAWALVLPLAVPPYLAAYAFGDFFHFSGPAQSTIRTLFGFETARDYWFPEIRSTGGAAFVLSLVLYPYVYLTARIVFIMQGRNIADVARTLGASSSRVFWRVLLPVARPAIVAGVALVLMETINDIGASEYLGVRTMTFAVYTTWLSRGSLAGAAQIAILMLVLVLALLAAENWARRRQRVHSARGTQLKSHPPRIRLHGAAALVAGLVAGLPVLLGFAVPVSVFLRYGMRRLDQIADPALLAALTTSLVTAAATAFVTLGAALLLINAVRLSGHIAVRGAVRTASVGYALPGTILGLGLLFTLAWIDNTIDATVRDLTGMSTGLLLSGTGAAVVIACAIRFLALAEGALRSGLDKLPPHIDQAARSLGRSNWGAARSVVLPLLRPALFTAGVLVFVDTIKELSATILLRPFGFSSLATHVYENASRGVVEDASWAALLIIAAALVPVLLLTRALSHDRDAAL